MSGATVPYRLRPHKAVDRRLFLELLNRCQRWMDLSTFAYVSMAAYSLEDQKLVHRLLGITRLLAFDMNPIIVARQEFNRPIATCKCKAMKSGDLVADIAGRLENSGIEDADGFITWLDYTSPRDIFTQLREFETLVGQYRPNDIVRVTVNAEFRFWAGSGSNAGGRITLDRQKETAYERLKAALGEYYPDDVKSESLGPDGDGIAKVLSRAFGKAAGKAVPAKSGNILEPLSITRYADGQQMLSVSAMVVERDRRDEMRLKLGLADWPFGSANWKDVKYLAVPDLTIRERLYLERHSESTAASIGDDVGFDFDEATAMPGFLANFRQYYRHYPALTPVEV